MRKFEFMASKDASGIDYAKTIYAKEEPGFWTLENLAQDHNCEWWTIDEIATLKTKKAKATTQAQASRAYRLGKINAEKQPGVLSATLCDCIEYAEELEWNCETINGIASAYTDWKGELVGIEYYND